MSFKEDTANAQLVSDQELNQSNLTRKKIDVKAAMKKIGYNE